MIKLVILDVDGVLTDGTKTYDIQGNVISKRFNDRDFTAIKKLKAAEIAVCFLSGDENINKVIAKKRNIDFYSSRDKDGNLNKASFLPMLYKKYGAERDTTVYVGDDYFDIEIMKEVKYSYCPWDSPLDVQDVVTFLLPSKGGEGVIVALVRTLTESHLMGPYTMERVKEIDRKES